MCGRRKPFDTINNMPAEWKKIDVLINNAGLAAGRDYFEEADLDDWNRMIDTNVKRISFMLPKQYPHRWF